MSLKAFRRPASVDPDVNVLAQAVADYTKPLTDNPLLNGRLIKNVLIDTTLELAHGLGRDWVGYIVVNRNAPADIYTTNNNTRNLTLNLTSTSTVAVDLWVF